MSVKMVTSPRDAPASMMPSKVASMILDLTEMRTIATTPSACVIDILQTILFYTLIQENLALRTRSRTHEFYLLSP
jgi:hypothetical protein